MDLSRKRPAYSAPIIPLDVDNRLILRRSVRGKLCGTQTPLPDRQPAALQGHLLFRWQSYHVHGRLMPRHLHHADPPLPPDPDGVRHDPSRNGPGHHRTGISGDHPFPATSAQATLSLILLIGKYILISIFICIF